ECSARLRLNPWSRTALAADLLHVLGGRTFGALHDVELNTLAFGQRLEPLSFDRRVMNEAVLLPIIARDEAKPLAVVEPLDGSGRTHPRAPLSVAVFGARDERTYRSQMFLVIPALTTGSVPSDPPSRSRRGFVDSEEPCVFGTNTCPSRGPASLADKVTPTPPTHNAP